MIESKFCNGFGGTEKDGCYDETTHLKKSRIRLTTLLFISKKILPSQKSLISKIRRISYEVLMLIHGYNKSL